MSSISSSDRSRQDDKIRQTREEYEGRESENVKKRKSEMSRLEKRHNEEISKIADDYETRLESLKDRNRDTITEKDFSNNRKIEEVRQAYREALKNKMEENYNDREQVRGSYEGELKKQKQVNESQKENVVGQLNNEISSRDEKYSNSLEDNRKKTQEVIHANARKLNDAHEKEKDILVGGNETIKMQNMRETREMKKSFEGRLKDSERRREADNSRWAQKYKDTVVNNRDEYGDNIAIKQDLMNSERDAIRDKFENVLEKKTTAMDEQNQDFRDTVNERVNSQVRSRDSQIQRISGKLNNEISKNERLRGIERRNLTEAYEKRLGIVEEQREDAVDKMRDLNDERISNVLSTNQKLLRNTDRENKSQVNLMNARHREDRENIIATAKDQHTQVSNQAESRVRKVIDLQNKNNDQMGRYYTDSLDTMKGNYLEKMDQSREENMNERVSMNKEMTQRFRNLEGNFNSKLEQTVSAYENKLAELKDTQGRELKRLENLYTQRISERDKASRLEKESVMQKYEAKIVQSNGSHTDQLDRMNRRHQEDMQNLAVKVNSYNRKA
jgi:hypothetical protein